MKGINYRWLIPPIQLWLPCLHIFRLLNLTQIRIHTRKCVFGHISNRLFIYMVVVIQFHRNRARVGHHVIAPLIWAGWIDVQNWMLYLGFSRRGVLIAFDPLMVRRHQVLQIVITHRVDHQQLPVGICSRYSFLMLLFRPNYVPG